MFAEATQKALEKKLIFSLAAIVENLRNSEVLEPALKSLGARHVEVGTVDTHYPLVGQALLETLATYLCAAWTPDAADAWLEAYNSIAATILKGAENLQDYLEPELTFYDWVDLFGEGSPKVKKMIATLTEFHYGNRLSKEAINQTYE